jgi:hypothetical protein
MKFEGNLANPNGCEIRFILNEVVNENPFSPRSFCVFMPG